MHLKETKLSGEVLYDGKIVRLERDKVLLEDGTEALREVVRHPGGVCVLALTDQDEVLIVRQFRYPYQEITIEVPAGKIEYGEDPEECGKRELVEECGCTSDSFTYLGLLYPTTAYNTEIIRIYLATGLHFGKQQLDAEEFLDVERIPFDKLLEMVLNDEVHDSKTQIAVLRYAALRNKK
jgi:ADP-ribose pyrophosphatase